MEPQGRDEQEQARSSTTGSSSSGSGEDEGNHSMLPEEPQDSHGPVMMQLDPTAASQQQQRKKCDAEQDLTEDTTSSSQDCNADTERNDDDEHDERITRLRTATDCEYELKQRASSISRGAKKKSGDSDSSTNKQLVCCLPPGAYASATPGQLVRLQAAAAASATAGCSTSGCVTEDLILQGQDLELGRGGADGARPKQIETNISYEEEDKRSTTSTPKVGDSANVAPSEENSTASTLVEANLVVEENDDMYWPRAVELDPSFHQSSGSPHQRRNKWFLLCTITTITACCVTIAVVVSVVVVGTRHHNKKSSATSTVMPSAASYRETIGIRENIELVVERHQLDDTSSPHRKAFDWITHQDPKAPTPDQPNFLQRFFAAYFYFATSVRHEWAWCNPAKENESVFCTYAYTVPDYLNFYDFPPVTVTPGNPGRRWLSNLTECQWIGIRCDTLDQITEIRLRK